MRIEITKEQFDKAMADAYPGDPRTVGERAADLVLFKDPPRRFQRKRAAGWRKPPNSYCVGRPGPWGNKYDWQELGREKATRLYEAWLLSRSDIIEKARAELKGLDLGCWCSEDEEHCHADVLLRVANE